MLRKNLGSAAGVLILAVAANLSGCASTSDIDSLRSDIRRANDAAAKAAAAADVARKEAASASQMAADAKSTADEAKSMSMATDEKIDRMFKKAMYK